MIALLLVVVAVVAVSLSGLVIFTAITARRVELQFKMDEALAELDQNFAKWDQPADQKSLTAELKTILSNVAYLRTLIRDVDRALENAKAA